MSEVRELVTFLDKHITPILRSKEDSANTNWQPSDFLPDLSQEDYYDELVRFKEKSALIPDTVLIALIGNMITEEALPSYITFFNLIDGVNEDRSAASDSPLARWSRIWTAEENRHGDLLNKYVYLTGRVDMNAVESSIQRLIINGFDPNSGADLCRALVYTSFQERATRISHTNTARLADKAGDSNLARICRVIAGDEASHENVYKDLVKKIIEVLPNYAIDCIHHMLISKIHMPGILMDRKSSRTFYQTYSNITQNIGIYSFLDYLNISKHLIGYWGLNSTVGLSAENARKQEEIFKLIEKMERLVNRIHIPETTQLIWLKNPKNSNA